MYLSFAPHLKALPLDDQGLALLGEQGCDVFPGPVFAQLANLLDGSRAEADVVAGCDVGPDAAAAAITQLRRAGALVEVNGSPMSEAAAWWSSQLVAPDVAEARIREAEVGVQT